MGVKCCILRERFIWGLALGMGSRQHGPPGRTLTAWEHSRFSRSPGSSRCPAEVLGPAWTPAQAGPPAGLTPARPRRGGLTGVAVGAAWLLRPERAPSEALYLPTSCAQPPCPGLHRLLRPELSSASFRAAVGQVPPGLRARAPPGRPWLGFQPPPASEGHRTGPGSLSREPEPPISVTPGRPPHPQPP